MSRNVLVSHFERYFICLLPMMIPSFSQTTSATLTGLVTDPSQARLANVQLSLQHALTGVVQNGVTNKLGESDLYGLLTDSIWRDSPDNHEEAQPCLRSVENCFGPV